MPHGLDKIAATSVAGGTEDLIKILRKASMAGKKLGDTPENIAKKIMIGDKHGSGSFIIDALKAPLKKTGLGKKIDSGIQHVQQGVADLDMRAGKKVHDALTKNPNNKAGNWLGEKFIQNHQVKLEGSPHGTPDEMINLPAAGLTNPIAKAKDAVLPVAGAFAISNQIEKARKGKKEGGDTVKSAYTREELIKKIAAEIDGRQETSQPVEKKDDSKDRELVKKASVFLKVAADKIRELETHNEKLALENQIMYLEKIEKERFDEATKLAHEMNERGMIKKADVESKITELSSMDEDAFSMFKNAIENISSYNVEKDGIDSLTFVIDNNNISNRKTFADSINEAANEVK